MNKTFERNVNSNRIGTDKINSISENLTKIKKRKFRVRLCTYISEKNLGCANWSRCTKWSEYGNCFSGHFFWSNLFFLP